MSPLAWTLATAGLGVAGGWALVWLVEYGKRTTATPAPADPHGPRVIRRDGVNVVILGYREQER